RVAYRSAAPSATPSASTTGGPPTGHRDAAGDRAAVRAWLTHARAAALAAARGRALPAGARAALLPRPTSDLANRRRDALRHRGPGAGPGTRLPDARRADGAGEHDIPPRLPAAAGADLLDGARLPGESIGPPACESARVLRLSRHWRAHSPALLPCA